MEHTYNKLVKIIYWSFKHFITQNTREQVKTYFWLMLIYEGLPRGGVSPLIGIEMEDADGRESNPRVTPA